MRFPSPAYTSEEGGFAVNTLRDICRREVINLEKGVVIGTVDDIVFDEKSARIEALLIYGRPRLFGLLGRDSDVRIPWAEVISFGRDVILVSTPVDESVSGRVRPRFWEQ
jgi:YlmC/YmxH family sporulation protein